MITGIVSIALLGFVQIGVIQGAIHLAADFELLFVNNMGMPFNTGIITYMVLLTGLIIGLVYFSRKKGWWALNTLTLSFAMIMIG